MEKAKIEQFGKCATDAVKRGFTLVELLVVVAILGILGSIAMQNVMGNIEKSRLTAAKMGVDNVKDAVATWMMRNNKSTPPSNLNVLIEEQGEDEAILSGGEGALQDPWGNEYKLETKGRKYVIISSGPDEQFSTEDDIRSDKTEKKKNK